MNLKTTNKTGYWLTAIQYYNWHEFKMHRIDIPLGQPLHISGDTGVGKTTLLDGWLYALVGDETKIRFNAMAGPGSSRHVTTYIRWHKNGQPQRTDTGQAHVLMEWTHIKTGKRFVCGVVWDYNPTTIRANFLLVDSALSLELVGYAVEGDAYQMYKLKELREHLNHTQAPGVWNLLSSATEYRQKLAQKLGNLSERWFEILTRALGNIDTSNLTRVVRDLVIGCEVIEVTPLRTYVHEVQQAQVRCEQAEQQLKKLEAVIDAHKQYQNKQHEHAVFAACLHQAKLEHARAELATAKNHYAAELQQLNDLKEQVQHCTTAYQQARLAHERAQDAAQSFSGLLSEQRQLKRELQQVIARLEASQRALAQLRYFEETWQNVMATLAVALDLAVPGDWQEFIVHNCILQDAIITLNTSIWPAQNALQRWLAVVENKLAEQIAHSETVLQQLRREIAECRPALPEQRAAEYVKTQLEEQGHIANITILADLVEPTTALDSVAQGMLEGLLGARRWTLIPPETDFERCQQIYRDLPRDQTENIHLVRPSDVEKYQRVPPGSMAELIQTANSLARGLLNLHLGQWRWEPDESAAVAERASRVVSRGLQISGGTLYRHAPLAPHKCVFGQLARVAQQQERQARIAELAQELQTLTQEAQVVKRYQTALESLTQDFTAICDVQVLREQERIQADLQAIQVAIAAQPQGSLFIDQNPLQTLWNARENAAKDQAQIQERLDQFQQRLAQTVAEIAAQEMSLTVQQAEVDKCLVDWQTTYQTYQSQESTLEELIARLSSTVTMTENEAHTLYRLFTAQVTAYISEQYPPSATENVETQIAICWQAYTTFKEQELPQLRVQLHESQQRADAALVRHFVDRVLNLTNAHNRAIKNLNRAIQEVPLGSRRYRFAPPQFREDNPILVRQVRELLATYQEAIRNYGALESMLLEYLRRDHGAVLDQLAAFLAKEESQLSAEELRVREILLEPALYYDFQVEYQGIEDGVRWHNLTQHIAAGSGGEQQLPNYIVLIAAMAEVYGDVPDRPRILAFDEGFSKAPIVGTEGVRLMLDLGLQPLIVTPTGNTALSEVMGGTVYVLRASDGARYIKARFHEDYTPQYVSRL
ncbi:MAG: hypothetical protein JXA33_19820 [Anaerolineae bacterium]|nr:hypothetical protein [Anaerolineae bacterium]